MKRLTYNLIATLILTLWFSLLANFANAATLQFSWTANTANTDGYHLWEVLPDGNPTLVKTIPGRTITTTSVEATAPDDGSCRTYALTAYLGPIDSAYSDRGVWCPPYGDAIVPLFYIRPARPLAPGGLSVSD